MINFINKLNTKPRKELMKSNIYEAQETMIVMGSCVPNMQPEGYEKLKKITSSIYELCLEETHLNMAITKVGGMLRTGKVNRIIFVSVDKSPHCIQLHYIQDELNKMMNLDNIQIENYVIVDNELVKIEQATISLSKNLSKLNEIAIK